MDDTPSPLSTRPDRTRIFDVDVDPVDLAGAVDIIAALAKTDHPHTVVTPNLDHALKLRTDTAFRSAYDRASLIVADGAPFVLMSKISGPALPARVAGSELIEPVCERAVQDGLKVFFLGSSLSRLAKAAATLQRDFPDLHISGVYAPPMGFDKDADAQAEALNWLNNTQPDIIMVALGAPKQELWADKALESCSRGVFMSIGAGLDFISGEVDRAPTAFQKSGFEWLHRALSEPRRLGPRYLKVILALPGLIAAHFEGRKRAAK